MVSSLTINSLIHFEFTLVYSVRECFNFILLHVTTVFTVFPATLIEETVFPIRYYCLLCHRLIDQSVWVYFYGLCSIPMTYISVSVIVPYCFGYCSFVVYPEVGEHDSSSFVFLYQGYFVYPGYFVF